MHTIYGMVNLPYKGYYIVYLLCPACIGIQSGLKLSPQLFFGCCIIAFNLWIGKRRVKEGEGKCQKKTTLGLKPPDSTWIKSSPTVCKKYGMLKEYVHCYFLNPMCSEHASKLHSHWKGKKAVGFGNIFANLHWLEKKLLEMWEEYQSDSLRLKEANLSKMQTTGPIHSNELLK